MQKNYLNKQSKQLRKKKFLFYHNHGKKYILIGWKTFNHGVFQGKFGGDIKFPFGMALIINHLPE
jgi:hypothetical protein